VTSYSLATNEPQLFRQHLHGQSDNLEDARNNDIVAEPRLVRSLLHNLGTHSMTLQYNIYNISQSSVVKKPITVAARSKAWTVFARSNAGIMDSNSIQGMYVCIVCIYVVLCVGRFLATGWSPIQGVIAMLVLPRTSCFIFTFQRTHGEI
jgi:hypothetical protein